MSVSVEFCLGLRYKRDHAAVGSKSRISFVLLLLCLGLAMASPLQTEAFGNDNGSLCCFILGSPTFRPLSEWTHNFTINSFS